MTNPENLLDLNTATLVELRNLPGIGPALAERILSTRPFTSTADLLRLRGFSQALLAQLQDYITVIPPEAVPAEVKEGSNGNEPNLTEASFPPTLTPLPAEPVEIPQPVELFLDSRPPAEAMEILEQPEAEPAPADEVPPPAIFPIPAPLNDTPELAPRLVEAPPPQPAVPPRPVHYVTRGQAVGMAVVSAFISSVLSITLILALLLILNGGLRFARPGQITQLDRQVSDLESQASALQAQIDSADTQIASFQTTTAGLAAGMDEINTDVAELNTGLGELGTSIDELNTGVADLNTRMDELEGLQERVVLLEASAVEVQADLAALHTEFVQMDQEMDEMSLRVDALVTRSNRFEEFLDGLRALLTTLTMPEVPNP